jgi:hypothetical protein
MNCTPLTRSISKRYGLAALIALCVLTTAVDPVTAASASEPSHTEIRESAVTDQATPVQFQQSTPTNNSTVRHQNPAETSEEGNLTDLQQWVSSRVETTLVECARQVENTTNETCSTLEEEFPRLTTQYSDLAQQTETTSDDNVSRVLGPTGTNQQEFVAAVAAYRASLNTYREAQAQGNAQLVLDSARNVSRRGDRVVTLGTDLSTQYGVIMANSTLAVSPALEIVDRETTNVSETTEEIRTTEFEPTVLTLSSNRSVASAANPVGLTGQLRAENGTPLANRTVVVQTPQGTTRKTTNVTGWFATTYRPVTVTTGNTTVSARYRPGNDSVYIDSNAETAFSVRTTEVTTDLNTTSSSVAFSDELGVRGTVRVGSTRLADVPVRVFLGETQLTETVTNESGVFTGAGPVPASIASGSVPVTAEVAQEDIALTGTAEPASVQVDRTTPRLTIVSERLTSDTARIFGSMRAGGEPVSGATLEIRQGNTIAGTAEIGEEGSFETNASLPGVAADESTTLTVAYNTSGGNLESVVLQIPVDPLSDTEPPVPETRFFKELFGIEVFGQYNPTPLSASLFALLILLVLATAIVPSNRIPLRVGAILSTVSFAKTKDQNGSKKEENEWRAKTNDGSIESPGRELTALDAAWERLDAGETDEAIVSAYSVARKQLDDRFEIDPVFTHWELLFLYRDSLDSDHQAALERLTSAYERAAYSHTSTTSELAREAIESATTLIRDSTGQQPNGVQDDD